MRMKKLIRQLSQEWVFNPLNYAIINDDKIVNLTQREYLFSKFY